MLGSLEKNTMFMEDYCLDESEWAHHNITRAEFNKEKEHIKIAHFTHINAAKPWSNVWKILGQNYQIPLCPYRGLWWKIALEVTEFKDELLLIYNSVEYNALQSYAKVLGEKLVHIEKELTELKNDKNEILKQILPSALKRVQNHLCYKIGLELRQFQGFKDLFKLCFKLIFLAFKHKEYLKSKEWDKDFPLEQCLDYEQSKALMQSKTYKLGQDFIKHSKNWHKGALLKFAFVKIKAFYKDNK